MGTVRKAYLKLANSESNTKFSSGTTFLPGTKLYLYAEINDKYYYPNNSGLFTFEVDNSVQNDSSYIKTYKVLVDQGSGYSDSQGRIIVSDPNGNGTGVVVGQEIIAQTELTDWKTILGDYCMKFKYSINGETPVEYDTGSQFIRFVVDSNNQPVTDEDPSRAITYNTDKNNILFYVGENTTSYKKGGYYTWEDSSHLTLGDHRDIRINGVSFNNTTESHSLVELKEVTLSPNCIENLGEEVTQSTLVRRSYIESNTNNLLKIVSNRQTIQGHVVFGEHCQQVKINYFSTAGVYTSKIITTLSPAEDTYFDTLESSSVFVETTTDGDYRYANDSYYVEMLSGATTVNATCKAAETVDVNVDINSEISQISVTYWPSALGGETPLERVTTVFDEGDTIRLVKGQSATDWSITLGNGYTAPSSYLNGHVDNYTGFLNSTTSQYELSPSIRWDIICKDIVIPLNISTSQVTINLDTFMGVTPYYTNRLYMTLAGTAGGESSLYPFSGNRTIDTGKDSSGGVYSNETSPRAGMEFSATAASPSLISFSLVSQGFTPIDFTATATFTEIYQLRVSYSTGYNSHEIVPTAIAVSADPEIIIYPGETTRLKAAFTPSNASAFSSLAWSLSPDPKIVLTPTPSTGLTSVLVSPGQGDGGITRVTASLGSSSSYIDITYHIPISSYVLKYGETVLSPSSIVDITKGGTAITFTAEISPPNAQDSLVWGAYDGQGTSLADQFEIIPNNNQGTSVSFRLKADSSLVGTSQIIVKVKTQDDRLEQTFKLHAVIPATGIAVVSSNIYLWADKSNFQVDAVYLLPLDTTETIADFSITSTDTIAGLNVSYTTPPSFSFIYTKNSGSGTGTATWTVEVTTSSGSTLRGTVNTYVTDIDVRIPNTNPYYLALNDEIETEVRFSSGVNLPVVWVSNDDAVLVNHDQVDDSWSLEGSVRKMDSFAKVTVYAGEYGSPVYKEINVKVYVKAPVGWYLKAQNGPYYVNKDQFYIDAIGLAQTPDLEEVDDLIDPTTWNLTPVGGTIPDPDKIISKSALSLSSSWQVELPEETNNQCAELRASATTLYSRETKTVDVKVGIPATGITIIGGSESTIYRGQTRNFIFVVSPNESTDNVSVNLNSQYTGVSISNYAYENGVGSFTLNVSQQATPSTTIGITIKTNKQDTSQTETASESLSIPIGVLATGITVSPSTVYLWANQTNTQSVGVTLTPSDTTEVISQTLSVTGVALPGLATDNIGSNSFDLVYTKDQDSGVGKVTWTVTATTTTGQTFTGTVDSYVTDLTITSPSTNPYYLPLSGEVAATATLSSGVTLPLYWASNKNSVTVNHTGDSWTLTGAARNMSSPATVTVYAGEVGSNINRSITVDVYYKETDFTLTVPDYVSSGSVISATASDFSQYDDERIGSWGISKMSGPTCNFTNKVETNTACSWKATITGATNNTPAVVRVRAETEYGGVFKVASLYVGKPATAVAISGNTGPIYKGQTRSFTFTVSPSDNTDDVSVSLDSTYTGVSIIDYTYSAGSGSFKLKVENSATSGTDIGITVKAKKQDTLQTVSASKSISVLIGTKATGLSLSPSEVNLSYSSTGTAQVSASLLPAGTTETIAQNLSVIGATFLGLSTESISASGFTVKYTKSNDSGYGAADFVVTATTDDGNTFSATETVYVQSSVTSLSFSNPDTRTMYNNETRTFTVSVSPTNYTDTLAVSLGGSYSDISASINNKTVTLTTGNNPTTGNITIYVKSYNLQGDETKSTSVTLPIAQSVPATGLSLSPSESFLSYSTSGTASVSVSLLPANTTEWISQNLSVIGATFPGLSTESASTSGFTIRYTKSNDSGYGAADFVVTATTNKGNTFSATETVYVETSATSLSFNNPDTSTMYQNSTRTFAVNVSPSNSTNTLVASLDGTYSDISVSISNKTVTLTTGSNPTTGNITVYVKSYNLKSQETASTSVTIPIARNIPATGISFSDSYLIVATTVKSSDSTVYTITPSDSTDTFSAECSDSTISVSMSGGILTATRDLRNGYATSVIAVFATRVDGTTVELGNITVRSR